MIIACALFVNVRLIRKCLRDIPFSTPIGKDEISLHEIKFENLRPLLPSYGIVGYLTDVSNVSASRSASREYILTQYTLTPIILDANPQREYPLTVGNFHNTAIVHRVIKEKNLCLLKDFENGIYLFQKDCK